MTWPTITINQLNLLQGETDEVERRYLFIGNATKNKGKIISLNAQTDFDSVLGSNDSRLKRGLLAARENAGQNWFASVAILRDGQDWTDAVLQAQTVGSFEAVVYAASANHVMDIKHAISLRKNLIAKYGRWVRFIIGIDGPECLGDTWSRYEERLAELQSGVADYAVTLVPMIWGNEPFVNAGRACNRSVTIADALARVKTGAVSNLGNPGNLGRNSLPVDVNGVELPLATLQTLNANRFSVPMWYPGYDGIYWADDRTLDVEGGDYQSAETVRVIDKVARKIRLLAIAKIADASFNSSANSIAVHQQYFSKPMREMCITTQINGIEFPGEVKKPHDGDIVITWKTQKIVDIYVVVRTRDIPLQITISLMLDASLDK